MYIFLKNKRFALSDDVEIYRKYIKNFVIYSKESDVFLKTGSSKNCK